jgi:hypothetical protein
MSGKPNNLAQDSEKKGAASDSDEYEMQMVRVKKAKKPAETTIGAGQAKSTSKPLDPPKPAEPPEEPDDIEGVCLGANQCVGRPLGLRY